MWRFALPSPPELPVCLRSVSDAAPFSLTLPSSPPVSPPHPAARPAPEGSALPLSLRCRPRLMWSALPRLDALETLLDLLGRPRLHLATDRRPHSLLSVNAIDKGIARRPSFLCGGSRWIDIPARLAWELSTGPGSVILFPTCPRVTGSLSGAKPVPLCRAATAAGRGGGASPSPVTFWIQRVHLVRRSPRSSTHAAIGAANIWAENFRLTGLLN